MGARQILVEHRYKGRFIKAIKLDQKRAKFVLGSALNSDMRLLGAGVSGIHAAFLNEKEKGWKIVDLGGLNGISINGVKSLELELDSQSNIVLGEHELRVHPFRVSQKLFSSQSNGPTNTLLTHQEVVLEFHGGVEETVFLGANAKFETVLEGKTVHLDPPKGVDWKNSVFGPFVVKQRLVTIPQGVKSDSLTVDKELLKSLGVTLLSFVAILLLLSLAKILNLRSKPEESRVAQLIFDAKIVKKKRQKSAEVRTQVASQNRNETVEKPVAGNVRVGKTVVATKVISNIKASGLRDMIGKIALRAGNTKAIVQTNGDPSNNSLGRGMGTGSTIKGKFNSDNSTGYRVSTVNTDGKAGGSTAYQSGAKLAAGNVGSGEVGIIDEESVIDGGLDREVISSIIKESLGQIRYCYERHLSANPDLSGKVQVKFTIGPLGTVSSQEIGVTTLKNAMVEGCILRRVARWKFPQPKGGTSVIVTYPFLFKALN